LTDLQGEAEYPLFHTGYYLRLLTGLSGMLSNLLQETPWGKAHRTDTAALSGHCTIMRGAGCSAFGIAALKLTGAKIDYPEWYVKVKVPYDLVGGEYNNMLKVKPREVFKKRFMARRIRTGVERLLYAFHIRPQLYISLDTETTFGV